MSEEDDVGLASGCSDLVEKMHTLYDGDRSECMDAVCGLIIQHGLRADTEEQLRLNGNQPSLKTKRIDDKIAVALMTALKSHPAVDSVDLAYNGVTDEGVTHIANLLKDDCNLVEIDLTFNDIGAKGGAALASALELNTTLRRLHLSSNKIGPRAVQHIAYVLQLNSSLQFLDLDDVECNLDGVISLCTMLKNNTVMTGINLGRTQIRAKNGEHAHHIHDMLKANTGLERLHISRWDMKDSDTFILCRALRENTTLLHLDLSSNRIGIDGARYLAEYLGTNPPLLTLNLKANRILDEGAESLGRALTHLNRTLHRLNVQHNEIGSIGLCALARALRNNSALYFLLTWGNDFDPKASEEFAYLLGGTVPRFSGGGGGALDVKTAVVDGVTYSAFVALPDRLGLPYARDTIKV